VLDPAHSLEMDCGRNTECIHHSDRSDLYRKAQFQSHFQISTHQNFELPMARPLFVLVLALAVGCVLAEDPTSSLPGVVDLSESGAGAGRGTAKR